MSMRGKSKIGWKLTLERMNSGHITSHLFNRHHQLLKELEEAEKRLRAFEKKDLAQGRRIAQKFLTNAPKYDPSKPLREAMAELHERKPNISSVKSRRRVEQTRQVA